MVRMETAIWAGEEFDLKKVGKEYFLLIICVCVCVCLADVKQTITDWKEYLMKKLVGSSTLPVDFYLKVKLDFCIL